ncbi:MAG: O-acetyl-ADP-ribose deacetylase [Candidatus Omnitrophota bacterium]
MFDKIKVIKGDITKLKVDAIINAANTSLWGGGGVDGAIHRVAGLDLLKECETLGGCKTGDSKITKGYKLPAKFVIHTVGPVWHGGNSGEDQLLAYCYKTSFKLAQENNVKTIAFPCISTGVYHFPKERAANIAVSQTKEFLNNNNMIENVTFVCFDDENFNIYKKLIGP